VQINFSSFCMVCKTDEPVMQKIGIILAFNALSVE